ELCPRRLIFRRSRNRTDGIVDVERPCRWATDFEKTAGHRGPGVNTDGQDLEEVDESRKEGRGEAACGQEGETPFRRQPADREGLRRRARAGLHRGHAGLETRRRPPT